MSKIKKVLAVFLTLAMVMGMGLTTFAADGDPTITVKGAGTATTIKYVQVIEPENSERGWKFTEAAKNAYVEGFNKAQNTNYSAEDIIDMLKAANSGTTYVNEINSALNNVFAKSTLSTADSNPFTVPSAGVYAIQAEEEGFVYSPMAAYVGFTYNNGEATKTNAEVVAKKTPTTVTKTTEDENKVVEIGRDVEYTITGTVPYIAPTDTNKYYIFKDTITGAKYKLTDNKVNVKIGTTYDQDHIVTLTGDNSFTLDLTTLIDDENTYANQTVTITYTATVTDVQVGNTVIVGDGTPDGNNKYGSDNTDLYTGEIQLIKYASDENNDDLSDNKTLENAGFIVYKEVTAEGSSTPTLMYATFDANNKFVAWVDTEEGAKELFTDADGKIKVEGLDLGTYFFKEKTAPDGYSKNETPSSVTLTHDGVAEEIITAAPTTMIDTTLSSLPSTGGIGTTIFTIGGCLIMIIAAALFFASRRKNNK